MDTENQVMTGETSELDSRAELERQLERQRQEAREEGERIRRETIARCAISAAVNASDARDPELLTLLLERENLVVEDGQLQGLEEAMGRMRSLRPYLFQDGGQRPRFAAAAMDRGLPDGEEQVALRYRDNPWYKRGRR